MSYYADSKPTKGFYCNRVPYWSNPNVFFRGANVRSHPRAAARDFNPNCDADNHGTLNGTAWTVANFRIGAGGPARPRPVRHGSFAGSHRPVPGLKPAATRPVSASSAGSGVVPGRRSTRLSQHDQLPGHERGTQYDLLYQGFATNAYGELGPKQHRQRDDATNHHRSAGARWPYYRR